uniref:Protein Wnt n=1 Tax=Cyanoderma ruficeps TaxID=181631 RepID=A0A8C3R901_9PASS
SSHGPPRPSTAATALLCQLGLSSQHCRLLVPEQLQLCRRHLEVMHSIVCAARRMQALCQQSFLDMRWNCSSIQRAPRFGPDLLTGTREAAFVHDLAAAAVAQGIARSCASGELPLCSCSPGPSEPPAPGSQLGWLRGQPQPRPPAQSHLHRRLRQSWHRGHTRAQGREPAQRKRGTGSGCRTPGLCRLGWGI